MKKNAKVFIWIGMIIQFYLIYPIVIGILALQKLEQAKSKDELQSLGILTTLFCSLLGGIFMLCIKDEELSAKKKEIMPPVKRKKYKFSELIRLKSFLMYFLISLFLFVSFVFSFVGYVIDFPVPFIINAISIVFFLLSFILFSKSLKLTKLNYALIITFLFFSVYQAIGSVILSIEAYNDFYSYYTSPFRPQYEPSWVGWITFAIAIIIIVLLICLFIFDYQIKNRKNSKELVESEDNEITPIDNLTISNEHNDNEIFSTIEKLYVLKDKGIITEEEYEQARKRIVNKIL